MLLTRLWRHIEIIKLEKIIIKEPAIIPKIKLINIDVLNVWKATFLFRFSNSSETIQVIAILNPDVAIVTKKRYTDIIKVKIPIVSEPSLFERYILNPRLTNLIKSADIVRIEPFINNSLDFLKVSPINNIYK